MKDLRIALVVIVSAILLFLPVAPASAAGVTVYAEAKPGGFVMPAESFKCTEATLTIGNSTYTGVISANAWAQLTSACAIHFFNVPTGVGGTITIRAYKGIGLDGTNPAIGSGTPVSASQPVWITAGLHWWGWGFDAGTILLY